jgi:hypothetical protein
VNESHHTPSLAPSPKRIALDPAFKKRVTSAVALEPSPLRRDVGKRTALLIVASWLIALVVFTLAGGPRPTGRSQALMIGTAAGSASIASLVVWLSLSRGRSTLGRSVELLVPLMVGAIPAILGWKVFWSTHFPGALDEWPTRPGYRCLALTLGIAVCPLVAFVLTRRGSDPRRPILTGFAAGVGVGSAATLMTDLWCPVAFIPHLLLGHALPVALLGGLGAALGWLLIRLRGA